MAQVAIVPCIIHVLDNRAKHLFPPYFHPTSVADFHYSIVRNFTATINTFTHFSPNFIELVLRKLWYLKICVNLLLHKFFKPDYREYIMIIPIRCFSCGKPIAHLWEDFKKRTQEGETAGKVLEELGIERMCCRSVFLGQTDLVELISEFKKS